MILRAISTAPTIDTAEPRFAEFDHTWGGKYPAMIRLWRSAWEQCTPFTGDRTFDGPRLPAEQLLLAVAVQRWAGRQDPLTRRRF